MKETFLQVLVSRWPGTNSNMIHQDNVRRPRVKNWCNLYVLLHLPYSLDLHAQAIAYSARYETSTIRSCVLWNTGRTNWFLFLARPSNFTPMEQPSYDERGEKSLAKAAVRRLKTIYVKEKTSFSLTVKTERSSPLKPILILTC